jgi:hypothetical protein
VCFIFTERVSFLLQIFKQALLKMEENGNRHAENIEVDIGLVYW